MADDEAIPSLVIPAKAGIYGCHPDPPKTEKDPLQSK